MGLEDVDGLLIVTIRSYAVSAWFGFLCGHREP